MSLKSITNKIIASVVALYMVVGNLSIVGMGLTKVIAEDNTAPEITITAEGTRYVQYNKEKGTGAVLQTNIILGEDTSKAEHKQVAKTVMKIKVPEIEGIRPDRVSITNTSTKLTNGKEEIEAIETSYNKETGLLVLSYENTENYNQDQTKDEFEITYVYPEGAYKADNAEVKMQLEAKVTREYIAENSKINKEKSITQEMIKSKNTAELINFDTEEVSDIYKGYLYANVENKTNYETTYTTHTNLSILNSAITEKIETSLGKARFVNKDKKDIDTNLIEYLSSQITEQDFYHLLGMDGYINFYLNGSEEEYATIRYSEADKKGNRSYQTVYKDERDSTEAGKVTYPEETTSVRIATSNPLTEGNIRIENQKVIKVSANYGEKVENIAAVAEFTSALQTAGINMQTEAALELAVRTVRVNAPLKEPTTQMSLELSNKNLSTLAKNNITATIKLNDTNSSCQLFNDGKLVLTLPDNLTSAKIVNAKILYENGLQATETKIEDGKIIITLKGKQTTYDINNISGGVNIVLDLELDIKDTVPSHQETMELTYGKSKVSEEMNIVSKSGLLILNTVKSGDNKVISIDSTEKKIELSRNQKDQTIEQTIYFVNNYDKDLINVELIGTLGYKDENTNVNLDLILLEAIKVEGKKAEVYYTNDPDSNQWSKEYNANAKAYKIILEDNTIKTKSTIKVDLKLKSDDNLTYNQTSYLNVIAKYTYNAALTQTSTTRLMTEERKEDGTISSLQVETVTLAGDQVISNNDEVLEGQILKTKVTVKNNSTNEATYKLATTIENAVYYELHNTGEIYNDGGDPATRYENAAVGDTNREKTIVVPANSSVVYEYQYVVNQGSETVKNTINILDTNGQKVANEIVIENKVKEAKMKLSIEYAYNEENEVWGTMNTFLNIQNLTQKDLKNVKVVVKLSEQLSPNKITGYEYSGDNQIEMIYDDVANTLEISIDKIVGKSTLPILLLNDVAINTNLSSDTVSLIATCDYSGRTYVSNEFTKTIDQVRTNLKMDVSNNLKSDSVKVGDEIEYKVTINNDGVLDLTDSTITFVASEGLFIKDGYIVYSDGRKEKIELVEDNIARNTVNIRNKDQMTVVYNVIVVEALETMNSTFTLVDSYLNNIEKISTLKGSIQEEDNEPSEEPVNEPVDEPSEEPGNNPSENPSEEPVNDPSEEPTEEPKVNYSISGIAWLDTNKDGKREEDETFIGGITVILIDTTTGDIVKDSNGNNVTTTTDEKGYYKFENLEQGTYAVIFEIDTGKYTVTTYQKSKVDNSQNSDAILSNVNVEGTNKKVGITNTIELKDESLENIDIGLIENAKFDLSLDKQIAKVEVVNNQGTKTTEYKNQHFAKIDLVAKYMNNTNVIITYKFVIKNEGDVTGYVDRLVDNLPSGLEFSSELNKGWYQGNDGNLYTTELNGIAIKPGEMTEVELILTKKTTENTTGTFSNNAELEKISNIEAIEEKETATENNKSSADVVLSIKTGSPMMYAGITLGSIAIIASGAYIIKKRVINRGI